MSIAPANPPASASVSATNSEPSKAPSVRVYYRGGDGSRETDLPIESIADALADESGVLWLDIDDRGGGFAKQAETWFRDLFQFHPLSIEDALCETNVTKLDVFDHYLYFIFHAIEFEPETDELIPRDLDIFLGANFLVTYRRARIVALDKVRTFVERDVDNRLLRGPDHLLYQILDLGIDDHLAAIEHLDEAIDDAQDEIFEAATQSTLQKIIRVKRAVARLHRLIAPQREVINRLARDDHPQIGEKERVYFRDVYDGLVRLHDVTESVRDLVASALESYLSIISNRTNDIMKALTIATVLFLPMNFVVGFFGMNFFGGNIELGDFSGSHRAIFLIGIGLMAISALAIWLLGKRRGWY